MVQAPPITDAGARLLKAGVLLFPIEAARVRASDYRTVQGRQWALVFENTHV
jgi:hypothetical protein